MAYSLYRLRLRSLADMLDYCLPFGTVLGIDSDLDQLVTIEGEIDFVDDVLRQSVGPHDDHRFLGMSHGFEVTFLLVIEIVHWKIVCDRES